MNDTDKWLCAGPLGYDHAFNLNLTVGIYFQYYRFLELSEGFGINKLPFLLATGNIFYNLVKPILSSDGHSSAKVNDDKQFRKTSK